MNRALARVLCIFWELLLPPQSRIILVFQLLAHLVFVGGLVLLQQTLAGAPMKPSPPWRVLWDRVLGTQSVDCKVIFHCFGISRSALAYFPVEVDRNAFCK